jgi:hypothetical protein
MVGQSRSHNWVPKLVFRMFNMALNNAYVAYKKLIRLDVDNELISGPDNVALSFGRAMRELAHSLC